MKKLLKISGITLVLLIVIILIIPIAFKGKIIDLVKTEANKMLNAKVDFDDVDLSLITNFPDFSVDIENLSVVGVGQFEGDTLTSIGLIHATLDFMSVVSGDQIKINAINIDHPNFNVWVKADGAANYDIMKASDEPEVEDSLEETEAEGGSVSLNIDSYQINHANIVYNDETMDMLLDIADFSHEGKGDFAEDIFTLFTNSSIEAFSLSYEGMTVLDRAAVSLDADLAMDLTNMKFSFMENMLKVNALGLGFDGYVAMPTDDIDMDLNFNLLKNDLTEILSLVPAEFAKDLEGVAATGDVAFYGFAKGIYNDVTMPGFGISLKVGNGSIQYPDLPKSIENIQILADVKSPEGSPEMENLKVAVDQFYMEIGKTSTEPNTIDAKLFALNVMTSPDVDATLKANLNLASFKDVVPLEEEFEIGGKFMADAKVAGNVDDISNQLFEKFTAEGNLGLTNFIYKDASQDVAIDRCEVALNPKRLDLKALEMNYDGMNMSLNGFVEDYVLYALTDTTLVGEFNFIADVVDANKYMTEDTTAVATDVAESNEVVADSSEAMEIVLIPNNLDVKLNATIGKVLYDNMVITDIKGKIKVKDEIASLDHVTMKTLGADIEMTGSYNTQNHAVPVADFTYDIEKMDLQQAIETFNTIERMAPIAKQAHGDIASKMSFRTELDSAMNPIMNSINAQGDIRSVEILLEGGEFLEKMADKLKASSLAKQKIKNLDAKFTIRDGKVTTSPFDVKIDDMTANISGYSTFDNEIEYMMKMEIPRDALGGDFNKMAEGLLASANAFLGGNMSMGEYIDVDVRVHGALDDPEISPVFAGMDSGDSAKDVLKDTIKDEIDKQKEELEKKAHEEAAEQADKIIADAQKEVAKLVKSAEKAGDDLRKEAKKQGDKLIKDSKNPFAKEAAKIAAKQLEKTAEEQAKKLVAEAEKQGDKLLAAARKKADELLEE